MKNRTISYFAVFSSSIALALSAFAQGAAEHDRYIVQLTPGNRPEAVAAAHGVTPRQVFTRVIHGFAAEIPPGRLIALAKDPRVAEIAIDQQVFALGKPTKPPPEPPPSGEIAPAGVVRIAADKVWGTTKGSGIGVAVLDTGLDFTHRDLPCGNWSFVSPGFTYTQTAQDDNGHGTHVGGIIAALQNGIDVVGVAPGATLYAVKVLDNSGSGWDSDIIAGLEAVAATTTLSPPIKVLNMSLGRLATSDDVAMHNAIKSVVSQGITVVVAAGNDSRYEVSQMVPAGFPEVIAVASTTARVGTSNNRRVSPIAADTASFFTTDGAYNSASGIGVAISAPGEEREDVVFPNIYSVGILSTARGGGTTRMGGTSMAAPHVAGVVALLLANTQPALTPAEVKTKIMIGDKEGVAPLNSPTGSYTFDGEREGILYAPKVLGLP